MKKICFFSIITLNIYCQTPTFILDWKKESYIGLTILGLKITDNFYNSHVLSNTELNLMSHEDINSFDRGVTYNFLRVMQNLVMHYSMGNL